MRCVYRMRDVFKNIYIYIIFFNEIKKKFIDSQESGCEWIDFVVGAAPAAAQAAMLAAT